MNYGKDLELFVKTMYRMLLQKIFEIVHFSPNVLHMKFSLIFRSPLCRGSLTPGHFYFHLFYDVIKLSANGPQCALLLKKSVVIITFSYF